MKEETKGPMVKQLLQVVIFLNECQDFSQKEEIKVGCLLRVDIL